MFLTESNPRHHCRQRSLTSYATWHSWRHNLRSDWDPFVQAESILEKWDVHGGIRTRVGSINDNCLTSYATWPSSRQRIRSNWNQFVQAEDFFHRGKHVLILTISMQTRRFLLKRVWSAGAPRIFAPARTPQKPQIFGKGIFSVLLYNAKEQELLLPNCPPIRSYLSYLI